MAVHAGMLRATRTGATNICRKKARDLLNDVLQYVVQNKCLFCIAVSDRETLIFLRMKTIERQLIHHLGNGKVRCMKFHPQWEVRFRTKLESPLL